MIKKIKNFICKLIGIKQCACPEDMDEHSELYLKIPEPDVQSTNQNIVQVI